MAMKAGMRRAALVAGVVLVAVTAASCGESSNASAPKSTTADGASSSTAQDPFCDKWVEVDGEGQKLSDPSVPPDVRTQAAGAVVAALDAAPAPDAITTDVSTIKAGIQPITNGEPGDTESPEFTSAQLAVGRWVHSECAFQTVELSTEEYHYSNLPDTLESGVTSFAIENHGNEPHMMLLAKVDPKVNKSLDELIQESSTSDGTPEGVTEMGGGGIAMPGSTGYFTVDLEPGRYAIVCPLPVGWNGQGPPPEAPPHMTQGMAAEFTVE